MIEILSELYIICFIMCVWGVIQLIEGIVENKRQDIISSHKSFKCSSVLYTIGFSIQLIIVIIFACCL